MRGHHGCMSGHHRYAVGRNRAAAGTNPASSRDSPHGDNRQCLKGVLTVPAPACPPGRLDRRCTGHACLLPAFPTSGGADRTEYRPFISCTERIRRGLAACRTDCTATHIGNATRNIHNPITVQIQGRTSRSEPWLQTSAPADPRKRHGLCHMRAERVCWTISRIWLKWEYSCLWPLAYSIMALATGPPGHTS